MKLVALVLALTLSGCALRTAPVTPLSTAFQKGDTVTVIWDCLPQWVAQVASQALAGGQPLGHCYGEQLQIRDVRPDGWWYVIDAGAGDAWFVNPARAISIQRVQPTQRARR